MFCQLITGFSAKNSWHSAASKAGLLEIKFYEVNALPSELASPSSLVYVNTKFGIMRMSENYVPGFDDY